MADVVADARVKAQGKTTSVISPLALEAVRRIDALFDIARAINGHSAEERRAVRQEHGAPLIADLERWLRRLVCVAIDGCCMMPVFVVNR